MYPECSEAKAKETAQNLDQNHITAAGKALFDCVAGDDYSSSRIDFLTQVKQNEQRDVGADLVITFESGARQMGSKVGFEIK